jgi:succinylglutamate desuccinylase
MTKNQENPILGIRLGAVNKKRWENYCARNGKTQSTAIREAIEKAMDVQEPPKPVRLYKQVETVWKKEKKVRFPIRLTRSVIDRNYGATNDRIYGAIFSSIFTPCGYSILA